MYKSYGRLEINNGVRILMNLDFVLYYQKLFGYYTYNTVRNQIPKHKSHISIYLPDIHGKHIKTDCIKYLAGKNIEFSYDPTNIFITKKNVWMVVDCYEAHIIKDKLGIIDRNFKGFHLTILNFKNL